MSIDYSKHFESYRDQFIEVTIPENKVKKIKEFVNEIIEAKSTATHHRVDYGQERKRFTTGFLGEAAVEEMLGINIIDWTIGNSNNYHIPDVTIDNMKIGIKTVEYGKFPIIFKKNYYPQIVNTIISDNKILVCGLGNKEILNKYQSDDLILSPLLRDRGTKTGFYGFSELKQFRNLQELKNIYSNL